MIFPFDDAMKPAMLACSATSVLLLHCSIAVRCSPWTARVSAERLPHVSQIDHAPTRLPPILRMPISAASFPAGSITIQRLG